MYSVLGLPGFIDFDGNGTICLVDKHSRKCDLNFVCSYSRLAGLLPYAKSVANAIEYTHSQKLCLEIEPYGFSKLFFDYQCEARKLFVFLCQ